MDEDSEKRNAPLDRVTADRIAKQAVQDVPIVCILLCIAKWYYSGHQYITPWPLVRERIIPTERPPLLNEI
jgi:hypothetical protein